MVHELMDFSSFGVLKHTVQSTHFTFLSVKVSDVVFALFSADSIEDYIQNASSNVDSANRELAKANQYQVEFSRILQLLF